MAKKRRTNLGPRRKRMRRNGRLQSAKAWLPAYTGKNPIRGYRRWYGVDFPTAIKELESLGVKIDPVHKAQLLATVDAKPKARRSKRAEKRAQTGERELVFQHLDQNDHFAYVAGYTPGGAAFGITLEKYEQERNAERLDCTDVETGLPENAGANGMPDFEPEWDSGIFGNRNDIPF